VPSSNSYVIHVHCVIRLEHAPVTRCSSSVTPPLACVQSSRLLQ